MNQSIPLSLEFKKRTYCFLIISICFYSLGHMIFEALTKQSKEGISIIPPPLKISMILSLYRLIAQEF